jgi:hypothetical protein
MPRNDPKATGGMFIGRRPGTAPLRYRAAVPPASAARRRFDSALSVGILAVETVLCVSLWGPQPLAALWVGSQVEYLSRSPSLGILTAFVFMLLTLLLTLVVLKRVDLAWKLVRRAAGHEQESGALEWIFVVSLSIAVSMYLFYFFIIGGLQPSLAPQQ